MKNSDIPKVKLHMPLSWWSKVMITMDQKISSLSEIYGYGSVSMEIVIRKGIVKDVVFSDEFRLRQDEDEIKENLNLTKKE